MIPEIPGWAELKLVTPELWLIAAMCAVILVPFVNRNNVAVFTSAAVAGLIGAMAATASIGQ